MEKQTVFHVSNLELEIFLRKLGHIIGPNRLKSLEVNPNGSLRVFTDTNDLTPDQVSFLNSSIRDVVQDHKKATKILKEAVLKLPKEVVTFNDLYIFSLENSRLFKGYHLSRFMYNEMKIKLVNYEFV